MAKFSDTSYPKLTAMLCAGTMDELIENVKLTAEQGAEAFCILGESLEPRYKSRESFKRLFDAMGERPAYITNYIRGNSEPELSDDYLAEQLIDYARWGGRLIDVRTDMFCRSTDEVTRDYVAVQKQKELISEIHKLGAEVLMSTHIFEYRSPEDVFEIAKLQRDRGVDIAKIVTVANSDKELDDAFKTSLLLKEKLGIPFLYLLNGTHCRRHRLLSPVLGSCMYLCLENSRTDGPQPTIEEAKRLREKFYDEVNKNGK